jgi:hypothetical protein
MCQCDELDAAVAAVWFGTPIYLPLVARALQVLIETVERHERGAMYVQYTPPSDDPEMLQVDYYIRTANFVAFGDRNIDGVSLIFFWMCQDRQERSK